MSSYANVRVGVVRKAAGHRGAVLYAYTLTAGESGRRRRVEQSPYRFTSAADARKAGTDRKRSVYS